MNIYNYAEGGGREILKRDKFNDYLELHNVSWHYQKCKTLRKIWKIFKLPYNCTKCIEYTEYSTYSAIYSKMLNLPASAFLKFE